jgi:hypothetical protein
VSLRVAMGALCVLTGANDALGVGCKPADAPAGGLPLTDGVRKTANRLQGGLPLPEHAAAGQPVSEESDHVQDLTSKPACRSLAAALCAALAWRLRRQRRRRRTA